MHKLPCRREGGKGVKELLKGLLEMNASGEARKLRILDPDLKVRLAS